MRAYRDRPQAAPIIQLMADESVFNVGDEFGTWVDKRVANGIAELTSPDNVQKIGTAVAALLQPFITSETDRAIAGAEAAAVNVIEKIGAVLGIPVTNVINDLTGTVNSTEETVNANIGGLAQTLGNMAGQIISGVLADLPHLLTKENQKSDGTSA